MEVSLDAGAPRLGRGQASVVIMLLKAILTAGWIIERLSGNNPLANNDVHPLKDPRWGVRDPRWRTKDPRWRTKDPRWGLRFWCPTPFSSAPRCVELPRVNVLSVGRKTLQSGIIWALWIQGRSREFKFRASRSNPRHTIWLRLRISWGQAQRLGFSPVTCFRASPDSRHARGPIFRPASSEKLTVYKVSAAQRLR